MDRTELTLGWEPGRVAGMGEGKPEAGEVTRLLRELGPGTPREAIDRLLPLVYAELRRAAEVRMRREAPGQTLSPTALVHEAFIKLAGQDRVEWQNRAHFMGVAALAMRRVLVNAAEARRAEKRGGQVAFTTFDEQVPGGGAAPEEVLALDAALEALAEHSLRQARVVELRTFSGMTMEEIAEVLGVSVPTVQRDWRFARAWLAARLEMG